MRQLYCNLDGLDEPVLGRVESVVQSTCGHTQYNFFGGPIKLVPNKLLTADWHYFCVLEHLFSAIDQFKSALIDLNIGDIVLFNPSGLCTVVYEKTSFSNALLLTERCNCKCIMCPQPPNPTMDSNDLAFSIINLINEPTNSIGITGGEPTLAWDGLIKVLIECKNRIPAASIELLTNARILSSFDKAKILADTSGDNLLACVPIYSDISSMHDKIVNVRGAFWETVEGIYNLERLGVPVEIRFVVLKQNYQRLPMWSEFIYRFFPFANHIAIMGLEPIGLALQNLNDIWVDPLDYMLWLERSVKILNRRNLSVSIYNHQLCTLPRQLWEFSRKSISEWKNIFIDQCVKCSVQPKCAGFFQSSKNIMSRVIKAIME